MSFLFNVGNMIIFLIDKNLNILLCLCNMKIYDILYLKMFMDVEKNLKRKNVFDFKIFYK